MYRSTFRGVDAKLILHFLDVMFHEKTPEQRTEMFDTARDEFQRRFHLSPAQKRAEYDSWSYRMENASENELLRGMDDAWDMQREAWWHDMLHTCPEVIADLLIEFGTVVLADQNGRIVHYTSSHGETMYFRVYEYRGALLAHRLDYNHTAALLDILGEVEALRGKE